MRPRRLLIGLGAIALLAFCSSACLSPTRPERYRPLIVFSGHLASGFDLGVESSFARSSWVDLSEGVMTMRYPRDEFWGSVSLVAGLVTPPPRPSLDLSRYRTLQLELRGVRVRSSLWVGLRDRDLADNASGPQVWIPLGPDWRDYAIPLTSFPGMDLQHVYAVTTLNFAGPAGDTVQCADIRFLP